MTLIQRYVLRLPIQFRVSVRTGLALAVVFLILSALAMLGWRFYLVMAIVSAGSVCFILLLGALAMAADRWRW